jgi:hypothetical protein
MGYIRLKKRKQCSMSGGERPLPAFLEIAAQFHSPLVEAAEHFNMCETIFKGRCRELGITRWPSRKVNSLKSKILATRNPQERFHLHVQYSLLFTERHYISNQVLSMLPHANQQSTDCSTGSTFKFGEVGSSVGRMQTNNQHHTYKNSQMIAMAAAAKLKENSQPRVRIKTCTLEPAQHIAMTQVASEEQTQLQLSELSVEPAKTLLQLKETARLKRQPATPTPHNSISGDANTAACTATSMGTAAKHQRISYLNTKSSCQHLVLKNFVDIATQKHKSDGVAF